MIQACLLTISNTEKVTRGAAIITVKRWVPDVQPMDSIVREFSLQILRRLQKRPTDEQKRVDVQTNGDENMEDGQLPAEDLVQTPYLPEHIELPAQKAHVLQHVELLFALSVKVPEFLDEYVTPLNL
jgi:symplekin